MSTESARLIHETVQLLSEPDQTIELRALGVDGKSNCVASGYYSDHGRLGRDAVRYFDRARAIYVTLNPVNPALLARSNNRLQLYVRQTTSDSEIVQRRFLPIDFDPIREIGRAHV